MPEDFLQEEGKEYKRFYKLSLWWVEHRALLKKLLLGFFFAVNGIFILFAIWTMVDTFLISRQAETGAMAFTAVANQEELNAYTRRNRASELDIGRASVFPAGDGRYDFYAPVTNPNDDWFATFEYVFTSSAGETAPQDGFILPRREDRPFVAFGFESSALPRNAQLELREFRWHRVDRHQTGAVDAFLNDRLDIRIENTAYERQLEVADETIGRVSFDIVNATAFSYFDPDLVILLKRGANVVGTNRTSLSSLDAGETRRVNVNWFGALPSATEVEVVPLVNVLDPGVYKALEAGNGVDARTLPPPR